MRNEIEINTEKLLLRTVNNNDAPEIFDYRSDSFENRYQGWIPKTLDEVYDFIDAKISKEFNIADTWYQLVIVLKSENKLIGDIGIHFLAGDEKQVEIGCTLNKKYRKKGYAFEAMGAILNYLFYELNKHRVIASIDPRNNASMALVERLGLRKEAHFKESIFLNGEWVDDIVYAILKRELKQIKVIN